MHTLIFATNNQHKVQELLPLLPPGIRAITLKEAGVYVEISEPFDTLEENASEKSRVILELTGQDCFSEDTGLEVGALQGAPGVHSARYAGEKAGAAENIALLLEQMKGVDDRRARFRTVISLRWGCSEYQFEGICPGIIISEKKGGQGFGYDPVFVPDGDSRTFAEMNAGEKARYSHRAKAVAALVAFLQATQK